MHYLICDLNIQKKGHYIGYNQYILNNIQLIKEQAPANMYSFLFNAEAKEYLEFPDALRENIHFIEDNSWNNTSNKDKAKLFKKAVQKANELKTDHMYFLDLDKFQLAIFLTKFPFKLSGVLFRPHHRINVSNNTMRAKVKSSLQRYKKIVAEKLLTYTKNVENIFILNDEEGVSKLNKYHGSNQFKYLPDPIFAYPSNTVSTKDKSTFNFLIFGAINERKNITAILRAYEISTFPVATELFIVGPSEEAYLSYVKDLISKMSSLNENKKITLNPSFVSNEEMDNYFHDADACLLIYKDFFGSSGLLGRAALHEKKVVGANVGLISELINQHNLGVTCDPTNPESISKALLKIIDTKTNTSDFQNFYKQYSPELFLKTLLR